MPEKIIIDSDCALGFFGRDIDDAFALLLALHSPELELLGITTCFGNIDEPRAYQSILKLLDLAGRKDIPVYRGARSREDLGHETDASRFIQDHLANDVALVPIAPLTNLATAELLAPKTLSKAKRIVGMGGFLDRAILPWPFQFELNFMKDPGAARIVLERSDNLSLLPLDLTLQVLFGREEITKVSAYDTHLSRYFTPLMKSWSRYMTAVRLLACNWAPGFPPHDPLAIAYLLFPDLFKTQVERVTIRRSGVLCRKTSGIPVTICTEVDRKQVLRKMIERIFT